MQGLTPYTQTLSSAASGKPFAILGRGSIMPGFLCMLSAGASFTYSLDVTGDDVQLPSYNPANGNWMPFTGFDGLTVQTMGTLGAMVTAIRPRISVYSTGILTFQLIQVTR